MIRKFVSLGNTMLLLIALGIVGSSDVFAADKYRVSMQVFHFGEMIAQPVMDVEEGETAGGTYSVPGKSQYKIVVLLRPSGDDQVFASIQFTSGNIDVQPNILVDIGKKTETTIDNVRLNLLIQRVIEVPEGE